MSVKVFHEHTGFSPTYIFHQDNKSQMIRSKSKKSYFLGSMGIKFELYQYGSKHLSKRLFEAFEADGNTYDTALEIIKIGFQNDF